MAITDPATLVKTYQCTCRTFLLFHIDPPTVATVPQGPIPRKAMDAFPLPRGIHTHRRAVGGRLAGQTRRRASRVWHATPHRTVARRDGSSAVKPPASARAP